MPATIDHLHPVVLSGRAFTPEEAAEVAACPDLGGFLRREGSTGQDDGVEMINGRWH